MSSASIELKFDRMSKTYHPGETVTGRYVVMTMIIIVNEEENAYEDDDGDTDMMNFSHDNDERVHISTKSVFKYEGVELFLEGLVGLHHQHLTHHLHQHHDHQHLQHQHHQHLLHHHHDSIQGSHPQKRSHA